MIIAYQVWYPIYDISPDRIWPAFMAACLNCDPDMAEGDEEMSLQYDEIKKEEFDMIPDEYYYGQSRYVAESWEGNKIYVLVTIKFWDEHDPFKQYESRKYEIWHGRNWGSPDDIICTKCEYALCPIVRDVVREIADAYWRECHDEYVREQIESGESTAEEMAAAFCDSTHWVDEM